ncbi:MAG: SGNH/GDSL hydrolase family protein [Rubrivivax sp.]
MKLNRLWVLTAAAAALLAACGGGDPYVPGTGTTAGAPTTKVTFTSVVSFGDSLSDAGAYAPATSLTGNGQAPYFGGKFTTNSATGTVWVENLATALGLVTTPAEVGFAGSSVKCPAAANPQLASTCTAYGQGGARVTDPAGIGNNGGRGALTVPMVKQIANHLARFSTFKGTDLVLVFGGNNDVFVQASTLSAKAAQIQADAAAGKINADQANNLLLSAQLDAQSQLKTAATELAAAVKDQILGKGAKYVVVWNLPDSSMSPYGKSLPASGQSTLTTLVDTFNLWLREGLKDQPVQLFDANALFKEVYLNPGKYGIANNQIPACDAAKIGAITGGAVTDGSSLFCNSTPGAPFNGLRTGADIRTWQFADGVHPTTGGHKVMSDQFLNVLKSYGWL